jgi:divalent metal cation (Fe/Co/Zn/Cd) transporter
VPEDEQTMTEVSKALSVAGVVVVSMRVFSGVYLTYAGALWEWIDAILVLVVSGLICLVIGRLFRLGDQVSQPE